MTDILKLLSKPSKFTSEEKDWKPWKFSFMAYVGAVLVLLQMGEESNGYEAMRQYEVRASKMLPGQNLTGLQKILAFEFAETLR